MKGLVELFDITQSGIWVPRCSFSNNILDSGYDALARTISGDSAYAVNGMYIEYKNGVPTEPVISLDRTRSYYTSLASPYGYCRVRTVASPVYSESATKYSGNIVTFIGITDGTPAGGAAPIDGTAQYYSLALVAMPEYGDPAQDKLVAAGAIKYYGVFAPITKLANSQTGVRWSLQLGS